MVEAGPAHRCRVARLGALQRMVGLRARGRIAARRFAAAAGCRFFCNRPIGPSVTVAVPMQEGQLGRAAVGSLGCVASHMPLFQ